MRRSVLAPLVLCLVMLAGAGQTAMAADRVVAGIQHALNGLGYDVGTADGDAGPRTNAAIGSFLAERGLDPSLTGWDLLTQLQETSRRQVAEILLKDAAPVASEITVHRFAPNARYAYSPDGRLLAAFGSGVDIIDVASMRRLRGIGGECYTHADATFSPDSRFVAIGCAADYSIRIYAVESGALVRKLSGFQTFIASLDFSPDGRFLAGGDSNGNVALWNLPEDDAFWTSKPHGRSVQAVAFAKDGSGLVTCGVHTSDGEPFDANFNLKPNLLRVWNPSTGAFLYNLTTGIPDSEDCRALEFAPDGSRLYAATTMAKTGRVRVWDMDTRRHIATFDGGFSETLERLSISGDGSRIVAGGWDRVAVIWDRQGNEEARVQGFDNWIGAVALTPAGDRVIVTDQRRTVLADAANGTVLSTWTGAALFAQSVVPAKDGSAIQITGTNGSFAIDLATGVPSAGLGMAPVSTNVTFSPEGRFYIAMHDGVPDDNDNTVRLVDTSDNHVIARLAGHTNYVGRVAFSPGETMVATSSWDGTVKLWDTTNGALLETLTGHGAPVREVAFSPDGALLASGDTDGDIRLWSVPDGEFVRELKAAGQIEHLVFAPDGATLVAAAGTESLEFWDLASGTLTGRLEAKTKSFLYYLMSFEPDGRTLAIQDGDTLLRGDVRTGQFTAATTLESGLSYTKALPGGDLALAGSDYTTWLIDARTGQRRLGIFLFAEGQWVTMTPEGFFNASERGAANLSVVRGLELVPADNVFDALFRPDLVREALGGDPDGRVREAAAVLDLDDVLKSGAAPTVAFLDPQSEIISVSDTVELSARVLDAGGGIGNVEWRVNGVTLGVTRGIDRLAETPAVQVIVSQTLTLDPGENRVEVLAYNAQGLVAGEPAVLSVSWDGETGSTPPKLFVMAIGVDDYWDSRLQLNYAVSDAAAVVAAFSAAGEGLYASVEVSTVLNADATAGGIDAAFEDMAGRVHQRDVFVLFVAGHGKTQDGRYYFLPQDFRYRSDESIATDGLGQDRFQQWLAMIPARKSVLLYDTCDSGALTGEGGLSRGLEEVAALSRMTRAMGRTVLSASTDDAPALEGYEGHGVFTYALLAALAGGDADRNGAVEVTELASMVDRMVPEISYAAFGQRQVPQMTIMGSDFPLARPQAAAADKIEAPTKLEGPTDMAVPTGTATVTVTAARVHVAPSADSAISQTLPPGTPVRIVGKNGDWRWIERDGSAIGFVLAEALSGAD